MKLAFVSRLSFRISVIVCVMLGSLLGAGTAYAHALTVQLISGGPYDYGAIHYHPNQYPYLVTYYYVLGNSISKSGSNVSVYNLKRYSGYASSEDAVFGYFHAYDGDADYVIHYTGGSYWPYFGQSINGCSTTITMSPTYSYSNWEGSEALIIEQTIGWGSDDGYTPWGADYNGYLR